MTKAWRKSSSARRSSFSIGSKKIIVKNIVPILFSAVCITGIAYSGVGLPFILLDMFGRFERNSILVVSLIIPILTGMGLNFGIVLGAMAGQLGLLIACLLRLNGIAGILLAVAIALPFSYLFGWLSGILLNKTKGQEMITSMILGFFASGIYQFVFLFVMGGIVKINAPDIMLSNGIGIRNSVDLAGMKSALDEFQIFNIKTKVNIFTALIIFAGTSLLYTFFRLIAIKILKKTDILRILALLFALVFGVIAGNQKAFSQYKMLIQIPLLPLCLTIIICIIVSALSKTKVGQDMRAVGQNLSVSAVAGIDVNKTRLTAICISTVLAAVGQIVFLQNIGNINTYSAHENVGMFAAAALLIGGASVDKATIGQALIGTVLFHILFSVSPMAGRNIFGNPIIGEYFRVFVAYGIIAVTLVLHAWKQGVQNRQKLREAGE